MPIVFGPPEAYDPGIAESYGRITAERENMRNQAPIHPLQIVPNAGGGGGGGGGGGFAQGELTPRDQAMMLHDFQKGAQEFASKSMLQELQLNQVEQIRMNKLQYGISSVQQAMAENGLDKDIGQDLILQMQTEYSPLRSRAILAQTKESEMRRQAIQDGLDEAAKLKKKNQDFYAWNPGGLLQEREVNGRKEMFHLGGYNEHGPIWTHIPQRPDARAEERNREDEARRQAYLRIHEAVYKDENIPADKKEEEYLKRTRSYDNSFRADRAGPAPGTTMPDIPALDPMQPRTPENIKIAQEYHKPFDPQKPIRPLTAGQQAEMRDFGILSGQVQQAIGDGAPPPRPQGLPASANWERSYDQARTQLAQELHQKIWEARAFYASQGSVLGMTPTQKKDYEDRKKVIDNEIRTLAQRINTRASQIASTQQRELLTPGGFGHMPFR